MRISAAVSIALVLLAAACSDLPSASAPSPDSAPPGTWRAELRCTADVRQGSVVCASGAEPGSGPGRSLTIGGQHVYVRLTSSDVTYNPSDSIFQMNVTVQNLMTQAFGTPDGEVDTGLRVFFVAGPVAIPEEDGAVTVHNADGEDFFLAADQPYFAYEGPLYTGSVSESRPWQFKMDPEVTRFVFYVYVQGELPHEQSLLLFRPESQPEEGYVTALWGPAADSVFAGGYDGRLFRYTGGAWTEDESPASEFIWDVWGSSGTHVFGVGDAGTIVHWDGTDWSLMTSGLECTCETIYAVWGSGPSDVYAVADGGIILHYDGAAWAAADTMPVDWLGGVWGSGPDDVFVVGDNGAIFHNDGTGWSPMTSGLEDSGEYLNSVWGLSGTDVYAAASNGVLHYDGTSWTPLAGAQECEHFSVWGSAADDLFVSNVCGIDHFDGSTWAYMDPGGFVTELWGFGPHHVLTNPFGAIARGSR